MLCRAGRGGAVIPSLTCVVGEKKLALSNKKMIVISENIVFLLLSLWFHGDAYFALKSKTRGALNTLRLKRVSVYQGKTVNEAELLA